MPQPLLRASSRRRTHLCTSSHQAPSDKRLPSPQLGQQSPGETETCTVHLHGKTSLGVRWCPRLWGRLVVGGACWRQNTRFSSVKSLYEAAVAELPGKKVRKPEPALLEMLPADPHRQLHSSDGSKIVSKASGPALLVQRAQLLQNWNSLAKSKQSRTLEVKSAVTRHVVTSSRGAWGIFGLPPRLTQGLQAC